MGEHTLGPWKIIDGNVFGADAALSPFTDDKGEHHPDHHSGIVAIVYRDHEYEADGANARLIAAAPELLEALKELSDWPLNSKCFDGMDAKNASQSLQDIADYIEYKWSTKTRNEFVDKFEKNVKLIQSNPESFPKSDINNDLHKCVVTKQTSIFYKFNLIL